METLNQLQPQVAAELENVFKTIPLEEITRETGLGLNELSQVITTETETGIKTGTLAAAISNSRCPAGKMVRGKFKREGIEGVQKLFHEWELDEPGLAITVSASTMETMLKKK